MRYNIQDLKVLGYDDPRMLPSRELGAILHRKIWVNDPILKEEVSSYKSLVKTELKRRRQVAKAFKAAKAKAEAERAKAEAAKAERQKAVKDGVKSIRRLFYELAKERERDNSRSLIQKELSGRYLRESRKTESKVDPQLAIMAAEMKVRREYISWWKNALAQVDAKAVKAKARRANTPKRGWYYAASIEELSKNTSVRGNKRNKTRKVVKNHYLEGVKYEK